MATLEELEAQLRSNLERRDGLSFFNWSVRAQLNTEFARLSGEIRRQGGDPDAMVQAQRAERQQQAAQAEQARRAEQQQQAQQMAERAAAREQALARATEEAATRREAAGLATARLRQEQAEGAFLTNRPNAQEMAEHQAQMEQYRQTAANASLPAQTRADAAALLARSERDLAGLAQEEARLAQARQELLGREYAFASRHADGAERLVQALAERRGNDATARANARQELANLFPPPLPSAPPSVPGVPLVADAAPPPVPGPVVPTPPVLAGLPPAPPAPPSDEVPALPPVAVAPPPAAPAIAEEGFSAPSIIANLPSPPLPNVPTLPVTAQRPLPEPPVSSVAAATPTPPVSPVATATLSAPIITVQAAAPAPQPRTLPAVEDHIRRFGVLGRGNSGPAVRELQEFLREQLGPQWRNNSQELRVDGHFGPQTEAALQAFQRRHPSLRADGLLGSRTLAVVRESRSPEQRQAHSPEAGQQARAAADLVRDIVQISDVSPVEGPGITPNSAGSAPSRFIG